MNKIPVVVLGAGPAGLGAAYRLASRKAFDVTVVERSGRVGGNAGSFEIDGAAVDYGSHRLHPACPPPILADIKVMLGSDLLVRPRHGRIRLRGRWLHFPLKLTDLVAHTPPSFAAGTLLDALPWRRSGNAHEEESFASVLERGLGRTICEEFYFPYARKIWGIEPSELDAEQARRRVSAGSLGRLAGRVARAAIGRKRSGRGIFYYPRNGYGQISEAYREAAAAQGARVLLNSEVKAISWRDNRVNGVNITNDGGERSFESPQVLSTIPLTALIQCLRPSAPDQIIAACRALSYRSMLLIYLVLDADRFTEYDAHYFPESAVAITRLSEPKNYGLLGREGMTVLCAELPCSLDSDVWSASESALGRLVLGELEKVGLPVRCSVRRVEVKRLAHAYPIYARDYRRHFEAIDAWLTGVEGLVTLGRQGLFAHDNTHHTLAMAYAASESLADDGTFDRQRWARHRLEFQAHVVED